MRGNTGEIMQHSDQPYIELDRARKAIEDMRQAGSLEDLEEHWKEYLRRLERVWNKAENHFRKSPKWDSWHGPFKTLRRKDSMLAYLVNARGADEHTVSEITERHGERVTISPGLSGRAQIRSLRFGSNGEITKLDVEGDTVVEFHPARVRLLPITNRGVIYPVPTEHLSERIDPDNLLDVAARGLAFYTDLLNKAEAFFIQPAHPKR